SGISALDIWLYPNYGSTAPGSSLYDNLVVSKMAGSSNKTSQEGKSILNSYTIFQGQENKNSPNIGISISPNPTTGTMYLDLQNLEGIEVNCIIYNSAQQIVWTRKFFSNHELIEEVNLGNSSEGIYYLMIQSLYGSVFKTVVLKK
ncbi:T9SS type A sorting domain-containing protein, partial [Maribacter algicola]